MKPALRLTVLPAALLLAAPSPSADLLGVDNREVGSSLSFFDGCFYDDFRALITGLGHTIVPLETFEAGDLVVRNPDEFPNQPEQNTHGLLVRVQATGRVFARTYGTNQGGMQLWAETEWNSSGQKLLRFPFSIPGF